MSDATTSTTAPPTPDQAPRKRGPQTPEAKERVRRNALKHGLRAEVLVLEEDREAIDRKIDLWNAELGPTGDVERTLVARAAVAAVRLERCVRAERAALEESAERALRHREARERKRVRAVAQNLVRDPAGTVLKLGKSPYGLDWMIGKWRELARELNAHCRLSFDRVETMLRLVGYDPSVGHEAMARHRPVSDLWKNALRLMKLKDYRSDLADIHCGMTDSDLEGEERFAEQARRLPNVFQAFDWLGELIAGNIRELLEEREALAEGSDETARREEVLERALVDTGEEARRRHRYERMNDQILHRSLRHLFQLRKAREASPGASEKVWDGEGWSFAPLGGAEAPALAPEADPAPEASAPNNSAGSAPDTPLPDRNFNKERDLRNGSPRADTAPGRRSPAPGGAAEIDLDGPSATFLPLSIIPGSLPEADPGGRDRSPTA